MRIADLFTDIAVYIYQSLDDAKLGDKSGGSGFLVHVPLELSGWREVYVVTNRHVVHKAKTPAIRFNRKDGGMECLQTEKDDWRFHPDGDDVAIFPFRLNMDNLRIDSICPDMFFTKELIHDEDIGIGDETVMVGRFISHDGRQKNTPAVRFGNIAMMPHEGITSPYGIEQESFLVETRSLPGYSGSAIILFSTSAPFDMTQRRFGKEPPIPDEESPPFSEEKYKRLREMAARVRAKGPYLLGIDWCHLQSRESVRETSGKPVDGGWFVEQNSGMAGVIPAWKILDILNSEELVAMRRKEDEKITQKKAESPVSLDYAEARQADEPFTQEDFNAALKKVTRKKETADKEKS